MKYFLIPILGIMTSCSFLPFLAKEVKEGIEFEEDAIKHEIEFRSEKHMACKAALHGISKTLKNI